MFLQLAGVSTTPPSFVSSANFLRVHSNSSSIFSIIQFSVVEMIFCGVVSLPQDSLLIDLVYLDFRSSNMSQRRVAALRAAS